MKKILVAAVLLATDVCRELGVAVDDLYAVAERHLDCQTDGCHFNGRGYDLLAEAVAKSVLPPPSGRMQSSGGER